jgi:hypothetical protein
MKIRMLMVLCFIGYNAFAQSTAGDETRIFSLTPISKKVTQVNGLAFGVGHDFKNDDARAVINGLNLEINPVIAVIFLAPKAPEPQENADIVTNGVHISTGGFLGKGTVNGLGISAYNVTVASNGVSVTGLFNISKSLNGVHLAGISLEAERGAGLYIAPFNDGGDFTGLQLGALNGGKTITGLQIGLINKANVTRGLQIGLWNVNDKRSLPFINW